MSNKANAVPCWKHAKGGHAVHSKGGEGSREEAILLHLCERLLSRLDCHDHLHGQPGGGQRSPLTSPTHGWVHASLLSS